MDNTPGNETASASGGRVLVGRSGRRWTLSAPAVVDGPWHFHLAEDSNGRPVGVRFGAPDRVGAEMELWAGLVESGDCQASDLDFGTHEGQVFLVHPRPSLIRFVVGRVVYRLAAEPIASGGQAAVYRATTPTGEIVAIKLAWPDQRGARLGQERDTLEQIHREDPNAHRWIVRVADSGIAPDGRRFLAITPWMDDTLLNWAWRRPPLPKLLHALEKSADALHDFHQAPDHRQVRVHRDIKPENLLIREVGDKLEVLLGDLGGARAERMLEQGSTLAVWTPKYAPPEQRLLLSRSLDEDFQSMDIYALGVTMFYVITWRYPDAAREDLLNERGQELNELYLRKATGLSPEEDQRYESLRREDPENFLDLSTASLWSAQDDERLRRAFRERCRDEVAAVKAADSVADALKKSIRVDYRTRMKKVSNLAAALQRAREIVEAAGLPPANAEVPEPSKLAVRADPGRAPTPPAVRQAALAAEPAPAPRPRPAPVAVGHRADPARRGEAEPHRVEVPKPEPPRPEAPKAEPPRVEAQRPADTPRAPTRPDATAAVTPPKVERRQPEVRKLDSTRPVNIRSEEAFPSLDPPGTPPPPRVADGRVATSPERTAAPRLESRPAARPPDSRGLPPDRSDPSLRPASGPQRSDPRNPALPRNDARPPDVRPPEPRGGGSDPRLRPLPIRIGGAPEPDVSDVTAEPTSESIPLTFDPFPDETAPGERVVRGSLSPNGAEERRPTSQNSGDRPLGQFTIVPDGMDSERPTTLDRPAPVRRANSSLPPPPPRSARPAVDPEATVMVRQGVLPSESGTRPLAMVAVGVLLVMGLAVLCGLGALAFLPGGNPTEVASPITDPVTPVVTPAVAPDTTSTTPATTNPVAPTTSKAPSATPPAAPSTTTPATVTPATTTPASSPSTSTSSASSAPTTSPSTTPAPATSSPTPTTTPTKTSRPTTTATTPAVAPDARTVTVLCCSGGELITVGGQSLSCPAKFEMAPKSQPVEWRLSSGTRKTLTVDATSADHVCAAETGSGLKVYYGRSACLDACQ